MDGRIHNDLSDDELRNRFLTEGIDPETADRMVRDRDRVDRDPDDEYEDLS